VPSSTGKLLPKLITFVSVIILLLLQVTCEERSFHHPHASHKEHKHKQPKTDEHGYVLDGEVIGDNLHLEEELETMYTKEDVENMTEEEKDYHYFRIHDYDNNNKLDGQEILKAVHHIVEEEVVEEEESENSTKDDDITGWIHEKEAEERKKKSRDSQLKLLVEMIDNVLEEDDKDKDGMLTYEEFAAGRRRGEKLSGDKL